MLRTGQTRSGGLRAAGDVLRCAGAFPAWVVGSGFATGQELMQFFARYGEGGRWGVAIVLAGFLLTGPALLRAGYDRRGESDPDPFCWACGPVLGGIYRRLTPAASMLLLPVLLSGAGAAIGENWGLDRRAGAALMAAAVLAAWRVGFQRCSAAAAVIAPTVALFSMAVAGTAVLKGGALSSAPAAPGWAGSGVLYLAMNCWGASAYHCRLGASAAGRRSAALGGALGALLLGGAIGLMSAAIAGSPGAMAMEVPALYLAESIAPALGWAFAWVLLLGIFSSCCAMLWTVCPGERGGGRALAAVAGALLLGRLPFPQLVARLYPLLGWAGLPFILCVFLRNALTYLPGRRKMR